MLKKELEKELHKMTEDRNKWKQECKDMVFDRIEYKKDIIKTFADCLGYYTLVKENNYSQDTIKKYSVNSIEEILFKLGILKQQAEQNSDRDYLKTFGDITDRLDRKIRDINESLNPNQ